MANTHSNISGLIPDFLPFYGKALPDVPGPMYSYSDPLFSGENSVDVATGSDMKINVTSVDSAGNYDEPARSTDHEMTASSESYIDFMKSQNYWNLDDPRVEITLDNYIEQNLAECRRQADEKKNAESKTEEKESEVTVERDLVIVEEKESGHVIESGILQPPGLDSTPMTQKPPMGTALNNAPRKPFAHLPRIYQRPKTLFEKKNNSNNPQSTDWETAYHIGNDKYVTACQFRGRKSVHIRQFYTDKNNKSRPTKQGLVLSPLEWRKLTLLANDVNKVLNSKTTVC